MSAKPTLRNLSDLEAEGLLTAEQARALEPVAARYAVAITPAMSELIAAQLPCDPIARQFVPDLAELVETPAELADPIGDFAHTPVRGVVHRYPDRVLLKPTHTCAVYCRFCFRREMVGPDGHGTLSREELDAAFAYISAREAIWEVIVTGGDPFVLSARRIGELMDRLDQIPHVKVVRFHTRIPVVAPDQVTDELAAVLRRSSKAVYVALHANHAREFTPGAIEACARLVDAGVPMLGQTVLLKGVNDDAEVLGQLMRAMVEARVKPYYLHHGDLAPGTGHMRTRIDEGQELMRALRGRYSGLCQPTYVLDIPGGYGKVPVGPAYLGPDGVSDPSGAIHAYPRASEDKA